MAINVRTEGDQSILESTIISLTGDAAQELKEKATELINSGVKNISLDLEKTNYIDSSGVGKLLFLCKKMKKAGGEFSIIKISSDLYEFLESLAITKVIKVSRPE